MNNIYPLVQSLSMNNILYPLGTRAPTRWSSSFERYYERQCKSSIHKERGVGKKERKKERIQVIPQCKTV